MILLLLVIVAFVAVRGFSRDVPDGEQPAVDYAPVAREARKTGLLAPAPQPLPQGWKATSVRFTPPDAQQPSKAGSWHLGLLTDDERYVALEETSENLDDLLPETVPEPSRGAVMRIDGRTWRAWTGTDDAYALTTSLGDGRDVLVGSPGGKDLVRGIVDRLALPEQPVS